MVVVARRYDQGGNTASYRLYLISINKYDGKKNNNYDGHQKGDPSGDRANKYQSGDL